MTLKYVGKYKTTLKEVQDDKQVTLIWVILYTSLNRRMDRPGCMRVDAKAGNRNRS